MLSRALTTRRLDRFGIGLSGFCLVHCVVTTVLIATLASAGGLLGSPIIHEVGLWIAMVIGAYTLGRGMFEHGFMMPSAVGGFGLGIMSGAAAMPHDGTDSVWFTMLGVGVLALGHRLNEIARD
ncbi:MerC domain-containing protein [Sphingomicrobium lutaoense]|uniref:MerC mercury resistance protein n=1 Tax=Sphingomicrobium lutaoense TaxID=515949 RepID=A0A839YYL8_9SPHN|nr:MerC domain-containing protein [Sphingomicrobium lutaoense]MBB3763418.1 hypothetical protein [Sphingomicrobium lutaoense]